jgi:quercetin dioxygenase-like cupin family protein
MPLISVPLVLALCQGPAHAEEAISYKVLATPVLEAETTIIGQPLAYPAGTAKVTAVIVTIPPGGETGWHEHAVPLFGYMLEGELTVDYGDKGARTYRPGDALMEAMNWPHNGTNRTEAPLRILAVYLGAEGLPNATAVPHP